MEEKHSAYDEEISLRDLIFKLNAFTREVIRYWRIPAFCILLAVGFQVYKYVTYTPVYPARITFSVDEDEGGGSPGLTGILGQFGLGSVRPSRYNLDKILALSKSRKVIAQPLFQKLELGGKDDFLANHMIRVYKLNGEDGKGKEGSTPFYFRHDSLERFTREENEMLMALYGFIIGPPEDPKKALISADYNEDTNIMFLEATTTDETLSLALAEQMFQALSDYYITKAIEKQLKTYTVISAKKDSVLSVLKSTEYQLANFKDSHRGLVMRTDQLSELRLQREITALSAMYAEVLKNTEVADFSLKNKMPFIQVIDAPLSPIQPTRLSLIRTLLMGILVGGAIGSVFVVGRSIYRDLMAKK